MGDLRKRSCHNCKSLFDAVSIGTCEVTNHVVKYSDDDKKALTCDDYKNKYYDDEN